MAEIKATLSAGDGRPVLPGGQAPGAALKIQLSPGTKTKSKAVGPLNGATESGQPWRRARRLGSSRGWQHTAPPSLWAATSLFPRHEHLQKVYTSSTQQRDKEGLHGGNGSEGHTMHYCGLVGTKDGRDLPRRENAQTPCSLSGARDSRSSSLPGPQLSRRSSPLLKH